MWCVLFHWSVLFKWGILSYWSILLKWGVLSHWSVLFTCTSCPTSTLFKWGYPVTLKCSVQLGRPVLLKRPVPLKCPVQVGSPVPLKHPVQVGCSVPLKRPVQQNKLSLDIGVDQTWLIVWSAMAPASNMFLSGFQSKTHLPVSLLIILTSNSTIARTNVTNPMNTPHWNKRQRVSMNITSQNTTHFWNYILSNYKT